MITPQEIQEKEFDKAVRGYNAEQVDVFLDEITTDLEALLAEKAEMQAQLDKAMAKMEEYKSQEGAVIKTLESARALMKDISASAEKRADIIMKNAELDADQILRTARDSVEKLKDEEKELTFRVSSLKNRFRNILQTELDRFEKVDLDIFGTMLQDSKATVVTPAQQQSAQAEFDSLTKVDLKPIFDKNTADDLAETKVIKKEE
ncbi:MAG: DivIVA domain-containing protein [Firmicutes bacterium]|nr:DivIVA domain-containing protein [Bacillota bacterium]